MVSFTCRPLFLRGKERRYPLKRGRGGTPSLCGCFGEEEYLLFLPGIEPRAVHHEYASVAPIFNRQSGNCLQTARRQCESSLSTKCQAVVSAFLKLFEPRSGLGQWLWLSTPGVRNGDKIKLESTILCDESDFVMTDWCQDKHICIYILLRDPQLVLWLVLWPLYLDLLFMTLQIWIFPCFCEVFLKIEKIFPTVLQLHRRRDNFSLADPIIFRRDVGNPGTQPWVGVMFMTRRSSRRCDSAKTGDSI
jgi:hypothetical protein